MSNFRPNAPFVNYFFKLSPDIESGANVPNAGGTLTFYADDNRSPGGLLATYSDIFDLDNPVVNDNPLELGADGSAPLIYLQDKLYYIEEHDSSGALVRTYEHFYYPYTGGGGGGQGSDAFINYIPDGQFDFPIDFTKTGNTTGKIYDQKTAVAWSWDFLQDANTTTQNFVTFESVADEIIEGSPVNQVVLTSQNVQAGESTKEFRAVIGNVNFSQPSLGQTGQLVVALQALSKLGGAPSIGVKLEKYYGEGGSPTEIEDIADFSITAERVKYWKYFIPSSNAGKTIGDGSTLSLLFQVAPGQICQVAMTNFLCKAGSDSSIEPIYGEEGNALVAAKVWGDAVSNQLATTGLNQIYQRYGYGGVTNVINMSDTGKLFLALKTAVFPDAVRCNGDSYSVSKYNDINIPYARLYQGQPGSIGNAFGSAGDLIITANANVLTFTLAAGGREKSTYTNGTAGAAITVSSITKGLPYGVSCALEAGSSDTVVLTWVDKFVAVAPPYVVDAFAPGDSIASGLGGSDGRIGFVENLPPSTSNIGNFYETYGAFVDGGAFGAQAPGFFTVTDTTIGSAIDAAVSKIVFNKVPNQQYIPTNSNYTGTASGRVVNYYQGFFEWATDPADTYLVGVNARARAIGAGWDQGAITPGVSVSFSIDGKTGAQFAGSQTCVVPLLSTDTIAQAASKFVAAINIPFVDKVTIVSTPAASSYFLFSSDTVDYYAWFKVDAVGTDPAVASRTGVEVDISATDTTTQIATKILNALDALILSYNVPDDTNADHVPSVVPVDCLTGYFIYL